MSHAQLYRCNYRLEQWQWGMSLTLWHWLPFLIQSKARRVSEFIILSHARIVSRVRFGFGHLSFFLSVWYPQLISNKFATTSQWMSPVWRQGALWGFQATVSLVRTGCYRSMTNTVIIVHEKCLQWVNHDRLPKLWTKEKSKRNNMEHWSYLRLPVSLKKGEKSRYKSNFRASHFADKFVFEYVARCFSKVRFGLAF